MVDPSRSAEVDAALDALPEPQRAALQDLRDAIHLLVPDATEAMSYGVATVLHYGPLLGLGATKTQCSLYVMRPSLVTSLRASLAPRRTSGGTINFDPDNPLPPDILERIVKTRVHENEAAHYRSTRPR